MIKRVFLAICFCCLLVSSSSCSNGKTVSKEPGLQIVTSFYPIYAMTKEVSGDLNTVRMIQSGAGIHEFEPSTSDVAAIYDADVFIYHSHTLESWAGDLDPSLQNSSVKVVEASAGMELDRVQGLEDVEAGDGIDEATLYDPHTWNDPIKVAEEAQLIAQQLEEIDPQNAKTYQKNADAFSKKAQDLYDRYKEKFDTVKSRYFVTSHTAFSYLAKRFNLTQLGISGVSTDQEPSAKKLAEIKEFVNTYNVKTIFVETGVNSKYAQTIADSAGIDLEVLSPLEADPQNNASYLDNLEANLKTLLKALNE